MFIGEFKFAVSCDDNCELWLSTDQDPKNIVKIASVGTFEEPSNTKIADFQAYSSQISKEVMLNKDKKYYIELIHKQGAYKDHVLVTWLAPSWDRIRTINSKDISSFIDIKTEIHDVNEYKFLIPVTKACQGLEKMDFTNSVYNYNRTKYSFTKYDYREDFFKMESVNMIDFEHVLPYIKYKPSYVLDFMPRRYEGVQLMHESSIYPDDFTELTHMTSYMNCKKPRETDSHFHYFEGFEPDEEDSEDDDNANKMFYGYNNFRDGPPEAVKKTMNEIDIKRKELSKKRDIKKKSLENSPRNGGTKKTKPVVSKFMSRKLMAIEVDKSETDKTVIKIHKKSELGKRNMIKNNKKTISEKDETIEKLLKERQSLLDKIKIGKTSQLGKRSVQSLGNGGYQEQTSWRNSPQTGNLRYDRQRYGSSRYNNNNRYRHRKRKMRVYKNKVFFKDGKMQNFNMSKEIDSKALMIHYHPLFGTAIYYMVSDPGRPFLWKYKTFLSKCKNEGNLPLYSGVSKKLFFSHFILCV